MARSPRLNKTTRGTVSVSLTDLGLPGGEVILNLEVRHPKVVEGTFGSYMKKVKIDLTKVNVEVNDATISS